MNGGVFQCLCGSKKFKELKMGGDGFAFQWLEKSNFWKGSGFVPEILACKDCGRMTMKVPESESGMLEDK